MCAACQTECCEVTWRKDVKGLLTEVLDQLRLMNQAVKLEFWAVQNGIPRRLDDMAVTLTDSQSVALAIAPVSAKGNPAKVDGAPVWSVSDEKVLALTVATDGLSAVVAAVGPVGVGQVKVTADADLGEGVKPLVGLLDVEVVAGEAVSLGITAGVPA